jgi:glycosyltransferase involved in cell wall biosynthesis
VPVLVVDDGSADGTGEVARAAGATVVRTEGLGLGAAVRIGLREAVALGADVVAFCDADGEYDPAEIDALAAPIIRGEADYVVGSRFAGEIRSMRPHRRLGNRALTLALSVVARARITDGQSGYRALSRAAATAAEIRHDFNYAQVLTLELRRKGFRYAEVPITYSFRESGDSFVRVLPYLCAVIPAVWNELRSAREGAAIRSGT